MILAIANSKGGSGKSTLAFNIAAEFRPTLVIDLDPVNGFSMVNRLRQLSGRVAYVIESPKTKNELSDLIVRCQKQRVLIDCGAGDNDLNSIALASANHIFTPTNDDVTEINGLVKFHDVLARIAGMVNRPITAHAIVNRVHHAKRDFKQLDDVLEALPLLERLNVTVPLSTPLKDAMKRGQSITEYQKYCAGGIAIRKLNAEIEGLINV